MIQLLRYRIHFLVVELSENGSWSIEFKRNVATAAQAGDDGILEIVPASDGTE